MLGGKRGISKSTVGTSMRGLIDGPVKQIINTFNTHVAAIYVAYSDVKMQVLGFKKPW